MKTPGGQSSQNVRRVVALAGVVLYWIDVPLLITPIPGAISAMASIQNRRIGDRIADTIVVLASSIRDVNTALPIRAAVETIASFPGEFPRTIRN